ncbi:MAG: efflux RND transporter periplasmic adaptor subunit [Pseudomonadota bacterium]
MAGNTQKYALGAVARRRGVAVLGALLLTGTLTACGNDAPAGGPPPMPVQVVTIVSQPTPNAVELPGRIEAVRSAEVRARVDGIVERRLFIEGVDVPAGAPLFQIDSDDLRAQLQQASANLSRAQAARSNASQISQRFASLVGRKAISDLEYESARSNLRQAEAGVQDAEAAVDRARLRLSYATVRAPIAGRVGRAQVSEGALVSAAGATLMTQVDQLAPIYAVFTKSSSDLQDLAGKVRSGEIQLTSMNEIEVRLIRENGQDYGYAGRLNFADLTVQPSTGSQVLRAVFPNPQRDLLPGQFVRGVVLAGVITNGVAVPERAVAIGGSEASVMIVTADNVAARRIITLGGRHDGKWVVRSGLKPGDKVIVDGWQRVQPGQAVAPRPAAKTAATAPAGTKE